jgi:hypothetical protein
LDLLGPLLSYQRRDTQKTWVLRPLLALRRSPGHTALDFVYPLASYKSSPLYRRLSIAGLFVDDRRHASSQGKGRGENLSAGHHNFSVRPLFFYSRKGEQRPRVSLLPFYLDFEDTMGWDRIHSVLFPLYIEFSRQRETRRFFPFPLLSTVSGPAAKGLRFWPLAGYTEVAHKEKTRYLLWPFYVSSDTQDAKGMTVSSRLYYPLHSRIDSTRVTHRGYLLPFFIPTFSTTIDREAGIRTTSVLWPLLMKQTELSTGRTLTTRLFPFWQSANRHGSQRNFYAWPLFRSRHWQNDQYQRRSLTGLLFLVRSIDEQSDSGRYRLHTVAGLLKDVEQYGRRRGQVPAPLGSLFPHNPHLETLYSPLWQVLAWRRESSKSKLEWNILWGLAQRRADGWHGPIGLSLDQGQGRVQK